MATTTPPPAPTTAPGKKSDDGEQKPPTHALMEKMLEHHKGMLDGVAGDMHLIENPETSGAIKKHCMTCHKSMGELVQACGKQFKMKMPDMPDELAGEDENEEKPGKDDGDADEELKDDLPEDEESMDDDDEPVSDDEEKAFEAQFKAMESQIEVQEKLIAESGVK